MCFCCVSKVDVGIVVPLDGNIYLVESGKIRWSFSTGKPIYSSYQAPLNHNNESEFYVDVGKDWELYWHSRRSSKVVSLFPVLSFMIKFVYAVIEFHCSLS